MKRMILFAIVSVLMTVAAQAQSLQSLFEKYADDQRFEYVSVGKGLMNMASSFGGITRNDKEMMSKMKGIKILSLSASVNSQLAKVLLSDLKKVVDHGNFETAVEARNRNERVHVYYRVTGRDNADLLIVTREPHEVSIIWLSGKMTREEMMNSFSYEVDDSEADIHMHVFTHMFFSALS